MSARKTSISHRSSKQADSNQRKAPKSARATTHAARKNGDRDQTSGVARRDKVQKSGVGKHSTATKDAGLQRGPRLGTKLATIVTQLKQKGGATIKALSETTGWQKHSVHGVISGTLRTKMGINVQTEVKDGVHYYRITE
jgi:hypothetical protein